MSAKYSLADANKILEDQFNKPNGRFYNVFDDPKKQKDAIEYLKTVINNLDTETLKNGSAHRVRLGAPSRKYLFLINDAPRHPRNS